MLLQRLEITSTTTRNLPAQVRAQADTGRLRVLVAANSFGNTAAIGNRLDDNPKPAYAGSRTADVGRLRVLVAANSFGNTEAIGNRLDDNPKPAYAG